MEGITRGETVQWVCGAGAGEDDRELSAQRGVGGAEVGWILEQDAYFVEEQGPEFEDMVSFWVLQEIISLVISVVRIGRTSKGSIWR